jgi:hypothetical protein
MGANPPETGILPTAARQFFQCRPVLNLPKGLFSFRIPPLALGDHIVSQKCLVHVDIYTLVGKNWLFAA